MCIKDWSSCFLVSLSDRELSLGSGFCCASMLHCPGRFFWMKCRAVNDCLPASWNVPCRQWALPLKASWELCCMRMAVIAILFYLGGPTLRVYRFWTFVICIAAIGMVYAGTLGHIFWTYMQPVSCIEYLPTRVWHLCSLEDNRRSRSRFAECSRICVASITHAALRAVDRDFFAVVPVSTSFVLPPCGVEAFCGTWDWHFILVGLAMTC